MLSLAPGAQGSPGANTLSGGASGAGFRFADVV